MTAPLNSRINFVPNYYQFDPAEIEMRLQNDQTDKSTSEVLNSIDGKKSSLINGIQYIESILGATVVKNQFLAGAVIPYLDFLLELYRYEEAAAFAEEVLNKGSYENADKDAIQDRLIIAALYLKTPERIAHLMPENMHQDAPFEKWILYIQFRYEEGRHHELLTKGYPNDIRARLFLLYICNEFQRIYDLSGPLLNEKSEVNWILWLAYKRLNLPSAALLLNKALESPKKELPPFFEDVVLEEVIASDNEAPKKLLANYFKRIKQNRIYDVKISLCLAKFLPAEAQIHIDFLKTLSLGFPNLHNKRIVILATFRKELQMEIWIRAAKVANPRFLLLSDAFKFYEKNKKDEELQSLLEHAEKNDVSYQPLKIRVVLSYATLAKSDEERKAALEKINDALKIAPFHKELLLKKLALLIALKLSDEAETFINQFWKHFPYNPEFAVLSCDYFESQGQFAKAYPILKDTYLKTSDASCFERLDRGSKEASRLTFLCECVFTKDHSNLMRYFEEALEIITTPENLNQGINALTGVERSSNYSFIELRARYLNKLKKWLLALADIDYLYDNKKECPNLKIEVFINLGYLTDACDELMQSDLPNAKELAEDIVLAMEAEQDDCDENYSIEILTLWERFKPFSFVASRAVAGSYLDEGDYLKSLAILNDLKKQDPDDMEVCLNRAICYKFLGQINTALMVIDEGLEKFQDERLLDLKKAFQSQLLESSIIKTNNPKNITSKPKPSKPITNTNPVVFVSEKSERKQKREKDGPKVKNSPVHLQKSAAQAVNPLADPLASIKEIAKKGESQTGPKIAASPAPVPIAAVPKAEAPKPIVKLQLNNREKVFLKRALDTLNEVLNAPINLDPEVIFRNYLYALLRVFTPLRLNSTHRSLIGDLKRIRDNARHDSDLISEERIKNLFNYLKTINLPQQLHDWIKEKSIITRLMLNNHILTVRKPKKTPHEKIISELEFILKKRGERGSWDARVYDRNAIKASVSVIGEASNFLANDLKALFHEYRPHGNTVAHEFFEEGDSVAYLEKYKEEDISPNALWELTSEIDILLNKMRENGLNNT